MYAALKNILKSILPKTWWRQNEATFRGIIYWFYKGKKHKCTICQAQLRSFILLDNKDLLCPRCGSLPRTRRLFQLLQTHHFLQGKLLHFSPPISLHKKLSQNTDFQYISSDYEKEFQATHQYDLTNIEVANNTFDGFIAYHILEHIEADQKAIAELYRVTKKGGKGLIQTPFKTGAIYEDFTIQSPVDRLLHYGQKDHVRIYSVAALQKRLSSAGFKVDQLSFLEDAANFYGFKTVETVLLVTK